MVNYLYDLEDIEKNHEAYAEGRRVVASSAVRRLCAAPPPISCRSRVKSGFPTSGLMLSTPILRPGRLRAHLERGREPS